MWRRSTNCYRTEKRGVSPWNYCREWNCWSTYGPVSTTEAYQALDFVEKGQAYLAQLRTTNFVRITAAEDEDAIVETYHDRVRESVVDHLDEPTIKRHNRASR